MGGPEWPPSPWRLLRTIAACWFDATEPPCSAGVRDGILEALGRAGAPRIWVPKASFNEIPFYQPVTKEVQRNVGGKKVGLREINSRVLHYDHFAVLAAPDVYFVFDTDLTEEQRAVLSRLLSRARYFGRAESRASVGLAEPDQQKPDGYFEARPSGHDARGVPMVRRNVLVMTPEFNAPDLWRVREPSRAKGKAGSRTQSGASTGDSAAPQHFVEALISAKKPLPDGTRWLEYELPRQAVVQQLPKRRISRASSPVVSAAEIHFRLFRRVPIPVLQTVLLARDFRDQAVRRYSHATGSHSVLLSGREEDGSVARGHRHAYYLPRPTRSSVGFLEQLVVVLPGGEFGVDQQVLDAMLGITRLLRRDPYPVLVVPEEVRSAPTTSSASTWRSLTPFLPPLQHRPRRDRTDPVQQMLRAVEESVERTPAQTSLMDRQVVPVLSHLYASSNASTESPQRHRITRRAGFTFQLEFSEPVQIWPAIGADAHFGLGQFEPVDCDGEEVAQQQHTAAALRAAADAERWAGAVLYSARPKSAVLNSPPARIPRHFRAQS
jgi:CRISPR-associated protein Csb2